MRCYIFSAAKIDDYAFLNKFDFSDGLLICADGGYRHAERLGLVPDIWLGDGDSFDNSNVCAKEKMKFPVEKDNTDTDLAVELALSRGCDEIYIIGGIGGRLDHEFSHFCLLKKILDRGGHGVLVSEKNEVTMEKHGFVLFPNEMKHISFFPFGGEVTDFSVTGLKYSASGLTLSCGEARASSNSFDGGDKAEIDFSSGYLLVIRADD